jgi:hypothetical protein
MLTFIFISLHTKILKDDFLLFTFFFFVYLWCSQWVVDPCICIYAICTNLVNINYKLTKCVVKEKHIDLHIEFRCVKK